MFRVARKRSTGTL